MTRLVMWDVDQTLLRAGAVIKPSYAAAFAEVTGRPYQHVPVNMAGRTDWSIANEVFALHGIAEPDRYRAALFAALTRQVHARRDQIPQVGQVMPGIPALLAALAQRPGVVQTVVTGNIAGVARDKVTAFGLHRYLDLEIGGYGTDHEQRVELVRCCLRRAAEKYGDVFTTLLVVGDTTHDIEAARGVHATAIGVATGTTSAEALRAAGAQVVVESFADTAQGVRILTG